jgi:hypothetical protein
MIFLKILNYHRINNVEIDYSVKIIFSFFLKFEINKDLGGQNSIFILDTYFSLRM